MKKYILMVMAILLCSCDKKSEETKHAPAESSPEKPEKDYSANWNVSILLDLSDRIDPVKYPNPAMPYHLRDVGYINSVAATFSAHIKSKKIKQMNDKMQVFFDPPPLNAEINAISKDLKISIDKENVSNKLIAEVETKYRTLPAKLYDLAIQDKHYVGSDTWKFFKNKIDYCVDENYRNILVILTDGYIYYENTKIKEGNQTSYLTPELIRKQALNQANWSEKMTSGQMGFLKANEDLSNLEILVLGVNPHPGNAYEEDVVKAYWVKWFEQMKVKRYKIRSAELPSDMEKVITDFINNN